MSVRTGRWSELSAEHEVRYNGYEEFLGYHDVQDIRSNRGVVWVCGCGVQSKDQTGILLSIIT